MKIFIINPDFGVTPEQMAARCHLLSAHVGPDVELHMECLVRQGLKTSRKAYPTPPLRKRTWQCGQL